MRDAARPFDLCGWHVDSDIALPELPGWHGDGAADIRIAVGPVPAALERVVLITSQVRVSMAAGAVLLHVAGIGGYLVEGGQCVTVAPLLPHDAPDVRLYLLGAVFGYLCHQRGLLPVHAAAVEVDGRALLFAGRSGAGKSTLAAAFWRRGFRLLSDDLSPIDLAGDAALVLPSLRRIRLWPDSATALAWPDGLERTQSDKWSRPIDAGLAGRLPAAAICHIGTAPALALERLRGAAAVEALAAQTYRHRVLVAMLEDGALRRVAAAAARIPLHYRLGRPRDYALLHEQIDRIVAAVRAAS